MLWPCTQIFLSVKVLMLPLICCLGIRIVLICLIWMWMMFGKMLEFILEENYFEFGRDQYRQTRGLAMGNHLAPPLAVLFMSAFEEKALESFELKPMLYKRYIDDIFVFWSHGHSSFDIFVEHLNNQHPNIKFTVDHSLNDSQSVSFLDLSISVCENIVDWELYIKPSHSGVHLSYLSSVPLSTKRAVARNQFSRAMAASTDTGRDNGKRKIQQLLKANDYPPEEIKRAEKAANGSISGKWRRGTKHKKNNKRSIIQLPFINDQLASDVSRKVRRYSRDVRIVYTSGPSLKDMLVKTSISKPLCPREEQRRRPKGGPGRPAECRACDAGLVNGQCVLKGVVYSMSCVVCGDVYIGETERPVRERFAEHYRNAKQMAVRTPWGAHYKSEHRESSTSTNFAPFNNAKILGRESSLPSRKIMEATEIRRRHPAVNSDNGWKLLD